MDDPEVFAINAGAAAHSTGKSKGIAKMRQASGSKAMVGDGEQVKTKVIGELPFKAEEGMKGTMGGIHLIPGAPFNWISGAKLLKLGFGAKGNAEGIAHTKDGVTLNFNLKIEVPKGMAFAA